MPLRGKKKNRSKTERTIEHQVSVSSSREIISQKISPWLNKGATANVNSESLYFKLKFSPPYAQGGITESRQSLITTPSTRLAVI